MASEFTLTPTSLPRTEAIRTDRSAAETYRDPAADTQNAIEARRKQFVEEIAKSHGLEQGRLVIERDTDTGRFIHKLIDPESGELVRQWPDDEWLQFAKEHGGSVGLWLDQRV